ncbi:hypothetical protein NQ152_07270 [Microbacterium sp. zg.B48]|uniref:hypothetical protein n=1 Tax=Microbacterium sp. zg.B48 TaxID=2969408 RepID=UPI00214CC8B8|nr:hypothetical protein [Microbacterium sp. zg.B48]MCR2763312.1 hypothetical protein [Microbacterium sp. zg.B48]
MIRRRKKKQTDPAAAPEGTLEADELDSAAIPPPEAVPIENPRPTPLYAALSALLVRLEGWVRSHGSVRIRTVTIAFWAVVAATGAFLLLGPVLNKPLSLEDITSSASTATDTWIARSFAAEYTLLRDDHGRMRMEVVERIEAHFPDDVAESGVERVIASQFQGHDLALQITGARWGGAEIPVTVTRGATSATVGMDTGQTLTGDHDVELRYTLFDVAYPAVDDSTQLQEEVLDWNVFGPAWPHAVGHSALTVTLAPDLVDDFSRQPSGGIAWSILSDSATLTPDSQTPDAVTYTLENDQRMPPHAQFWFTFRFAPGTFLMPPESALYWLQVIGPFVPLVMLSVAVLFSLAARAVAWGDARGRAWFVAQYSPQKDVSAALAARISRAVLVAPLAAAVERFQGNPGDPAARRALVRETSRAGRLGNVPSAWTKYLTAPAWREQFTRGLRRVPRGFVRDSFLSAAVALTVLQWGLVRQLSYQFALSVYWWPVAIVCLTTVLAAAIAVLALTALPLTHRGALAREHLLGLELYLDQTASGERTSLRDPLLPYTVLFSPPRRARRLLHRLLAEEGIARQVRDDPEFITGPRLVVRAAAILSVAAALALNAWVPASSARPDDDAVYSGDFAGDYGMFVNVYETDATLIPEGERVRMEVSERLQVVVGSNYRDVPQVLRQWQDKVDGHDTRLTITSVTIDGAAVPFDQGRVQGMALLQTRIPDEWPGEHEVIIRYEMDDVIGAAYLDGGWHDQLRWTALNPGWKYGWSGVEDDVERIDLTLRMPARFAEAMTGASGWLDHAPWDEGVAVREFGAPESAADTVVYRAELQPDDDGWWSDSSYLGARMLFPDGTFADANRAEWMLHVLADATVVIIPVTFAMIAVAAAIIGLVLAFRAPRRVEGGLWRDVVRWLPPWLSAAQVLTLFWATEDLGGDEPIFVLLVACLLVSAIMSFGVLMATRRPRARPPVPAPAPRRRPSRRR